MIKNCLQRKKKLKKKFLLWISAPQAKYIESNNLFLSHFKSIGRKKNPHTTSEIPIAASNFFQPTRFPHLYFCSKHLVIIFTWRTNHNIYDFIHKNIKKDNNNNNFIFFGTEYFDQLTNNRVQFLTWMHRTPYTSHVLLYTHIYTRIQERMTGTWRDLTLALYFEWKEREYIYNIQDKVEWGILWVVAYNKYKTASPIFKSKDTFYMCMWVYIVQHNSSSITEYSELLYNIGLRFRMYVNEELIW